MKIKLLNEYAKMPLRGSNSAAGLDLFSAYPEDLVIYPHKTCKIPTGIATEIPEGYLGAVFPRSGLATKKGLRLANGVAVIDSDYRGEWFIPLYNDSDQAQVVSLHERIAQVVLLPYLDEPIEVVEELNDTERGAGGFGSTGTH